MSTLTQQKGKKTTTRQMISFVTCQPRESWAVSSSCIYPWDLSKNGVQPSLSPPVLYPGKVTAFHPHFCCFFPICTWTLFRFPLVCGLKSPTMGLIIILGPDTLFQGPLLFRCFNDKHPMHPHAGNLGIQRAQIFHVNPIFLGWVFQLLLVGPTLAKSLGPSGALRASSSS